ncbi:MAG: response regulator, partial [Candidatus Poribacteria bacterium]|nr:response regulator [Candidatus Poribacteria bacterium]
GKPLNVLLAEDNRINQALVVMMLENFGHHVVVANNGEEVLALLEKEPADIILMDVQMPRMDGIEATKAIRNKEQGTSTHIPIIAITANAMAGDREIFLNAGMDEYISKPIGEGVLYEMLEGISDSAAEGPHPDAQLEQGAPPTLEQAP